MVGMQQRTSRRKNSVERYDASQVIAKLNLLNCLNVKVSNEI